MVQVVVPSGTSCEIVGKVTLSGTAETNPGAAKSDLQPITATIRVEQYCFFLVDSSKPTISTSPGSQVKFDLVIQNQGNGRDEFQIEIYNKGTLEKKGFKITQSDLRIEVDEGGQKEVQIIVDTPSGTNSLGQHSIMVKIKAVKIHSKPPRYGYYEFLVEVDDQYLLLTTEFFFLVGAIIIIIVLVILIRLRRNRQKRSKGIKKTKKKKS